MVGGVGVAESARPVDLVGGQDLVFPSSAMSYDMVMASKRGEVGGRGRTILGPWNAVVDVALRRGHTTSGEHAGRIAGLYLAALADGGSPSGGAVVADAAACRFCDGVAPLGALLATGDLAGDVGYHRAVSGKFRR